jgi:hypothetical protein
MSYRRAALEAEFLRMCRSRGPEWIESVIRPLRLPGAAITVRDIPISGLSVIVRMFRPMRHPASGVRVV